MRRLTLGDIIERQRKRLGYSKARLAREADISAPYLVQIVAGLRDPSEQTVRKLAGALQVHPYRLIKYAGLYDDTEVKIAALAAIEEVRRRYPDEKEDPGDTHEAEWMTLADYYLHSGQTAMPMPVPLDSDLRFDGPDDAQPPSPPPPEGWADLDDNARRLVQQLINKLRSADSAD